MTYEEAIDYIYSLDIDDKTFKKAMDYIAFLEDVDKYNRGRKLTPNEERRLREIVESK